MDHDHPSSLPAIPPGTMNVYEASFHVLCVVVGSGILNLPSALAKVGWSGLLLLVLLGLLSAYTAVLIGKCSFRTLDRSSDLVTPTYSAMGERAFGVYGRWFIAVQQHTILVGVATIYIVLNAGFLIGIVENINNYMDRSGELKFLSAAAIVTCIMWPHVFSSDMKFLSKFSFLTVVVTAVFIVIVAADILRQVDRNDRGEHAVFIKSTDFVTSFVAFAFAYGSHPVMPRILETMKDRSSYQTMVYVSFVIIILSYIPVTVLGYWAYGDETMSPITDQLDPGALRFTTEILLLIHLLISYCVVLNTPEQALERTVFQLYHRYMGTSEYATLEEPDAPANGTDHGDGADSSELGIDDTDQVDLTPPSSRLKVLLEETVRGTVWKKYLVQILLRTCIVALTFGFAALIPDFAKLLNLVASLTVSVRLIFPSAAYMKIFWHDLHWAVIALNIGVAVVGTVSMIAGLYVSIVDIIDLFHSDESSTGSSS